MIAENNKKIKDQLKKLLWYFHIIKQNLKENYSYISLVFPRYYETPTNS